MAQVGTAPCTVPRAEPVATGCPCCLLAFCIHLGV